MLPLSIKYIKISNYDVLYGQVLPRVGVLIHNTREVHDRKSKQCKKIKMIIIPLKIPIHGSFHVSYANSKATSKWPSMKICKSPKPPRLKT